VILRQAALIYTGSGAGLITQHGEGGSLSGNLSSGQKLVLETTNGENVKTTASASFTNAGSITLTNIETSANNATLAISAGILTNSGTITTEKVDGGARVLQGNITNTGTLAINETTTFNGAKATLLNEGTVTIATGTDLDINGTEGSFDNKTGVTEGVGGGYVQVEPGDSFIEGAGTLVGSKPAILRQAALVYNGSGAGLITQHGEGSTLSGNLSSGQKLVLESTNGENVKTTASASFTNAGSITLTNIETSANNATLAISAGTLTNSGTITTEKAVGGARNLDGNITNKGTLAINANTSFAGSEAKLVNEGAINVAATVLLSSTGNQTIANETSGTINPAGSTAVVVNGGTFDQGLGKTPTSKTTEPVIVDNGTLSYTGKGASRISIHGTSSLTGEVAKGQTLLIQSTNSQNATVTAGNVLVDSGTIELTNFETSANDVVLRLGSEGTGTLENKGKLEILFPEGGTRTIEGNLVNDKTLTLANGTQPLSVQGAFTLGTKASVKTTIAGSGNYGRVSATGAVTLAGKLTLKQLKFTGKAGESFAAFAGTSRTGEFASIKGTAIKGGSLSYTPHYTATALDLVVE
jgi:fibronectin-binding autotransporter adhesin